LANYPIFKSGNIIPALAENSILHFWNINKERHLWYHCYDKQIRH